MSIPGTPLLEIIDLADRCGKARRPGFPAHRLPRSLLPLVSLCLSEKTESFLIHEGDGWRVVPLRLYWGEDNQFLFTGWCLVSRG